MCLLNVPPDLTQMCFFNVPQMCLLKEMRRGLKYMLGEKINMEDQLKVQNYCSWFTFECECECIHTIFTEFTHFCREISLVAITRFGRHFLAKIWWEEAPKHFNGPGVDPPPPTSGQCPLLLPFIIQESFPK